MSRPFLVVHGHFYQPPRDNPWLGIVERQDSARPYHDWNERIAAECYTPNAFARVLDDTGRIVSIVNNYELMSFNFGATLLSWLEVHAPETYRRILDADARSRARLGFGNAIAQAYNHAILPLCNERDRRTQIRWGLQDFERRFGRRAESMWLPETAICQSTVEALVDEGLKFVILSPHQADEARDGGAWFDVSTGSIDPTQPYRLDAGGGRHLDVLFYDGPISSAIGFGGLLSSASAFVDRFASALVPGRNRDQLIHVATDGESYGHHTRWGERTLAYALNVEAPRRGFTLTNYAAYLAEHPPVAEARLKSGPDGEGTAWSCAHGVGRWSRDCGCSAGTVGFHQKWRAPLRRALDLLRDRAAVVYEAKAQPLVRDVWAARDAYVSAWESEASQHRFIEAHASRRLDGHERQELLRLCELQRYAQLMYTSCGWFFDEISGLEGTQILRYANRALELHRLLSGEDLEAPFLELLQEAPSNLAEFGNGAEVYRRLVIPTRVAHERLAAQEAILSLFVPRARELRYGDYQLERFAERRAGDARFGLNTGRIQLRWVPTGETHELSYAVLHVGAADVCCAVAPATAAHREITEAIWQLWPGQSIAGLLRAIERGFGPAEYTMRDLLLEERHRVLREVYGDLLKGVAEEYARLYDNHRHTMHVLRDAGLPIPEPLKQAAESVLGNRFETEIARQRRSRDPARYRRAVRMADDARERGLTLPRAGAQRAFSEMLCDGLASLRTKPTPERISEAIALLSLGRQLGIEAVSPRAQEQLWELLAETTPRPPELEALAAELGFAPPSAVDVESAAPVAPDAGESENAIDPATRTRPAPRAA
ncbi:MAG: glycosyl hydrolase, family 57 [Myxococcales bacterium]|nr:glycosyl hydrolase, family 57 [Myxococcales bacterium]